MYQIIVLFIGMEQGYKDMGNVGYQTTLGLELKNMTLSIILYIHCQQKINDESTKHDEWSRKDQYLLPELDCSILRILQMLHDAKQGHYYSFDRDQGLNK